MDYSDTGKNRSATLPVGSFAPNCLGLYDMAGNVFQRCNDLYDEHYYSKSANVSPKGGDERSGYPGGEGYHVASSEAASLEAVPSPFAPRREPGWTLYGTSIFTLFAASVSVVRTAGSPESGGTGKRRTDHESS